MSVFANKITPGSKNYLCTRSKMVTLLSAHEEALFARFCFGTYLLYRSHYTAGMHQIKFLFLWDWEFCIQHPSRISFWHWKKFSPSCDEKSAALLQTLNPGWQKLKLKELKKQNNPWSMELHLFATLHYLIRLSPGRQITNYAVRFIIL